MNETTVIIAFALLGLCIIGLACLLYIDREARGRRARITRAASGQRSTDGVDTDPRPAGSATTRSHTGPRHRAFRTLERHIQQAGMRVTPVELVAQVAIAGLTLYAIGVLVLGIAPVPTAFVSLLLPPVAAMLILRLAKARRLAAFSEGLPEALDVFSRGLKAGRPIADSIAVVVENSTDPIKSEFARCQDELRLGTSLPDSLERLCRRMPTPEVRFFGVATSLQGQTGGNLVETMENLAAQLRDRRKLKKKGKALTSEARASAAILAGLPFTVAAAIAFLNPSYLEPLLVDPRGQIMSVVALLSIGMGILMMIRMGKLHV
jgi:tight adherence protein B